MEGAQYPQRTETNSLFGREALSTEEKERIKKLLQQKLGNENLKTRPGNFTGGEYTYIEGWHAVELANKVFGFNGWSCSIVDITPDFIETVQGKQNVKVGVTAVVRVTLRDGSYHEDVGFGCSENKNKGTAIENAKKEAVTDARKRALRLFGNQLGNCLYDKQHLKSLKSQQQQQLKDNPPIKMEANGGNMGIMPVPVSSNPHVNNIPGMQRPPQQQMSPPVKQEAIRVSPQQVSPPVTVNPYNKMSGPVYSGVSQPQLSPSNNNSNNVYSNSNNVKTTSPQMSPHLSPQMSNVKSEPSNTDLPIDDFDYDALDMIEQEYAMQQLDRVSNTNGKSNAPNDNDYNNLTPPDKKRKPTVEVH